LPSRPLPLIIETVADLRERVGRWRRNGQTIALVPTMGNLHAGHLSLANQVRPLADKVIASIFVNPLQFGEGEDFDSYPRTLEADRAGLASVGVDAVFHPSVEQMYADGPRLKTSIRLHELEGVLCGQHRDGHFAGVATVVTKLFNLVQPDMAIFGRKDFQQLALIRQMVRDLSTPVRVLAGDTVRESDGLAMSSRNRYLNDKQRVIAATLFRTLQTVGEKISAGERDLRRLCEEAVIVLHDAGFAPDYVQALDAATLEKVSDATNAIVVAGAAYLGKARLIDNLVVTL
jgi:pantoate--beta-alanine ligase